MVDKYKYKRDLTTITLTLIRSLQNIAAEEDLKTFVNNLTKKTKPTERKRD